MAIRFTIFLIIFLAVDTAVLVNSTSPTELDSTLAALRSHNYNLFANALTTSDLFFELHSNFTTTTHGTNNNATSFTLFAPPDSALFALDMTATALVYTQTLRYHVVPRRIAAADLLRLPPGSCLPTLLPWREIRVHRRQFRRAAVIAVDGVNVVVPGLYYGEGVAVHGLAGVLNFRSQIGVRHGWSAAVSNQTNRTGSDNSSTSSFQTFKPKQTTTTTVANGSVYSPIPRLPVLNHSINIPPPPAANSPLPSISCNGCASPPEMMVAPNDESIGKLHDSTEYSNTPRRGRRRRHSAKLLEIEEEEEEESVRDDLLMESGNVERVVEEDIDPERPNPKHERDDQAQMSGRVSHSHYTDTGYEL